MPIDAINGRGRGRGRQVPVKGEVEAGLPLLQRRHLHPLRDIETPQGVTNSLSRGAEQRLASALLNLAEDVIGQLAEGPGAEAGEGGRRRGRGRRAVEGGRRRGLGAAAEELPGIRRLPLPGVARGHHAPQLRVDLFHTRENGSFVGWRNAGMRACRVVHSSTLASVSTGRLNWRAVVSSNAKVATPESRNTNNLNSRST